MSQIYQSIENILLQDIPNSVIKSLWSPYLLKYLKIVHKSVSYTISYGLFWTGLCN